MSLFLRKSFSLGKFCRLNLSKSGLGASFGITGARIGINGRGQTYVHAGREGIYYRKNLGKIGSDAGGEGMEPEMVSQPHSTVAAMPVSEITKEIQRIQSQTSKTAICVGVIMACALLAVLINSIWVYLGLSVWAIAALLCSRHLDVTHGILYVRYEMDETAQAMWQSFAESLPSSYKTWLIEGQILADQKYNAGATASVSRQWARFFVSLPARVMSNVSVPSLVSSRQQIYFFPDHILVCQNNEVRIVPYTDIKIENLKIVRFSETEEVPCDSKIVDKTFQYVNRNGGPDRRFANNPEIPIVEYCHLTLRSESGLNEEFEFSNSAFAMKFSLAIEAYKAVPFVASWRRADCLAVNLSRPGGLESTAGWSIGKLRHSAATNKDEDTRLLTEAIDRMVAMLKTATRADGKDHLNFNLEQIDSFVADYQLMKKQEQRLVSTGKPIAKEASLAVNSFDRVYGNLAKVLETKRSEVAEGKSVKAEA